MLHFVDELIETVSPQGALHLTAEFKHRGTNKASRMNGDFYSLRNRLGKHVVESLGIGSMEWRADLEAELYFFFEGERKFPGLDNKISAQRILTFSIGEKTWKSVVNQGRHGRILSLVEQLFGATECDYGFGRAYQTIISGPFDVLDPDPARPVLSIVDRDWSEITNVYRYNYFSSALLDKFKDSDALCGIQQVTCKTLVNAADESVGLAIYLEADESSALSAIAAQCLRLIRPSDAQPTA